VAGGLKKSKKNCEDCKRLRDPDSFAKGVAARIFEAFDCDNCEVKKAQPLEANENILELYNSIPHNYDGYTGLRILDVNAIKFLFEVFDVGKNIQDDYYRKLVYLHGEIVAANEKVREQEEKKREADRKWKEEKSRMKSKRLH